MSGYVVSISTEGAIFGIMALGLNVIWGWSGDFDLAYYGYVAVGAYMTLVLTIGPATAPAHYILGLQLPYPLAVLIAVITAMAVGLVVGLIALRHLRGIYFSIVTLGAVYVMYVIAGQYVPLFDGYNGLSGLFNPMADWFGLDYQAYQYFFMGLCLVMFALVFLLMWRISGSRFGMALRTLREDERAAAAFGRDIYRLKLKGYVLGAGVVLIVGNTIRLDILNRRAEIEVMKLVGASDGFARRPFLYSGIWYGLGGGLMALILVAVAVAVLARPVESLAKLYGSQFHLRGLGFTTGAQLLGLAASLAWLGSWLAATRHIRDIEPT